jgi:hypothetical protein
MFLFSTLREPVNRRCRKRVKRTAEWGSEQGRGGCADSLLP